MKVTIDISDDYVPDALWPALEMLATSISRLRRLKKPKRYQKEDLVEQLLNFDALKRTWMYYTVQTRHDEVDQLVLEDED